MTSRPGPIVIRQARQADLPRRPSWPALSGRVPGLSCQGHLYWSSSKASRKPPEELSSRGAPLPKAVRPCSAGDSPKTRASHASAPYFSRPPPALGPKGGCARWEPGGMEISGWMLGRPLQPRLEGEATDSCALATPGASFGFAIFSRIQSVLLTAFRVCRRGESYFTDDCCVPVKEARAAVLDRGGQGTCPRFLRRRLRRRRFLPCCARRSTSRERPRQLGRTGPDRLVLRTPTVCRCLQRAFLWPGTGPRHLQGLSLKRGAGILLRNSLSPGCKSLATLASRATPGETIKAVDLRCGPPANGGPPVPDLGRLPVPELPCSLQRHPFPVDDATARSNPAAELDNGGIAQPALSRSVLLSRCCVMRPPGRPVSKLVAGGACGSAVGVASSSAPSASHICPGLSNTE